MLTNAGTLASFTRSVYDLDGRVQYAMAANGAVTEYDYDADSRKTNTRVYTNYTVSLSSITNAIAPVNGFTQTQYRYDGNGNQIEMIDANGNTNDYQYDGDNRLVLTTYPLVSGQAARLQAGVSYDGFGNKISATDPAGVKTAWTYDFRGLVTSATLDAGGGNLAWTYG